MRRRNGRFLRTVRRGEAFLLAAGVLWLVSVTAGSESPGAAFRSVRDAAAEAVLKGELSGQLTDPLSIPVLLALRQTPLLYSTGDGALWRPAPAAEETERTETDTSAEGTETDEGTAGVTDQGTGAAEAPTEPETTESPPSETGDVSVTENYTPTPLPEEPMEPQPAIDNGMRARTLVPTSPDGYTVVGNVYISSSRKDKLDVSALRDTFDAHLTGEAPQILILHSHGSEAYTPVPGTEVVWSGDHRTTDPRYSVVKCGDVMAAAFAEAGISVLHDRTLYDYPEYTGSYDRSLAAMNSYLAQYPSIHFILDVHRDSISDGAGNQYKVISEIEGIGAAAQLTLVMGSDGSGAAHPRWMENLKLAVAVQEQLCGKYPTLMRPILLRKSRYNQHATTGSLLVEVGASGNAPEEAQLAARLFAEELAEVLLARTK